MLDIYHLFFQTNYLDNDYEKYHHKNGISLVGANLLLHHNRFTP